MLQGMNSTCKYGWIYETPQFKNQVRTNGYVGNHG